MIFIASDYLLKIKLSSVEIGLIPKIHFPRMSDEKTVEFLKGYMCSRLFKKFPFTELLKKDSYIELFTPFIMEIV